MLRRRAVAVLLGAARSGPVIERLFGLAHGAAVLLDFRTRRVLAVHGSDRARQVLSAPGSTLKPFSLLALLEAGKLGAEESLLCPLRLTIAGRSLACSHPPLDSPMRVRTALAYSCNCFVAHFASRFEPGELAGHLARAGFPPGRVGRAAGPESNQLQALGESGVRITALELALAYYRLASRAAQPILEGLEGAVEFGTAQQARVPGVTVAGKTGSAGGQAAWFAGFAPSRAPRVVVTVLVQGRSGGADAAPIAGRILQAYWEGRL